MMTIYYYNRCYTIYVTSRDSDSLYADVAGTQPHCPAAAAAAAVAVMGFLLVLAAMMAITIIRRTRKIRKKSQNQNQLLPTSLIQLYKPLLAKLQKEPLGHRP